jgi:hypothetical protein
MRTPRLFVEAKGLGENINDPRWANQIISYAAVAGVEWVALTDGAEWRIYNAHAPVPVEQKLFRSVKVDGEGTEVLDTLSLLSTENMRENRIQELWRGYFIDRQVNQVLHEVFNGSEPPSELVNLVAKRAARLGADDVRASLLRVRGVFDWPSPEIAPPTLGHPALPPSDAHTVVGAPEPTHTPPAPVAKARPDGAKGKKRVSSQEKALRLTDLLYSGRLKPGEIVARYDGQQWRATLEAHGGITFQGRTHSSLSQAGEQVKITARGPHTPRTVLATDGWDFWKARDEVSGDLVTLKEIRRRAVDDTTR